MNKFISIILALVMIFSFSTMAFASDFEDIAEYPYADAIEVLDELEIVNGYSEDKFAPYDYVTRGQIAAIMVRAIGDPRYNSTAVLFDDVPYYHMFSAEIHNAVMMGLMQGCGNGIFNPDGYVTYDQIATIILNAMGYPTNMQWPLGVRMAAADFDLYEDMAVVTYDQPATRGEICQMIYNAFDCYCYASKSTFINLMGYKFADPTFSDEIDEIGHQLLTFKEGKKEIVTEVIITTEKLAEFKTDEKYKVGKKTIEIDNEDVIYFLNGKEVLSLEEYIEEDDTVKLIYLDDEVIAVVAWEGVNIPGAWEIEKGKDRYGDKFVPGISTLTDFGEFYIISNEYEYGYIEEIYFRNDDCVIILSNDEDIKIPAEMAGEDLVEGKYVMVFYDYAEDVAGYRIVAEKSIY